MTQKTIIVISAVAVAGVLLLSCVIVGGVAAVLGGRNAETLITGGGGGQVDDGAMDGDAFRAQRPVAATVRGYFAIEQYYSGTYRKARQTHYCIGLMGHPDGQGLMHATMKFYVPKESDAGKRLFDLLKNGKARELTIRIRQLTCDGSVPQPGDEEWCIMSVVRDY